MFARHRDFLYKRSQNGAHLGLVARLTPGNAQGEPPAQPAAASPADSKTSDAVNPLTSAGPVAKTTDTPTTSPTPNFPFLPLPTPETSASSSSPSPPPPSSPSPTRASSTSTSSSASTHTTSSVVSTPSSVASSTGLYTPPALSTNVVSSVLFTPTSTVPPAATSSASSGSPGGTNTGAIIGGIAGTLAGIAILGFLLMWCMRRQRNRDIDDFDAQAFKRQSAILVDDPVEPSRSYNPRPPTMIERHNASPALAAQTGYGGQNFYGGYSGYNQQPPYAPPEMIQPVGSPPPQAYGAPPMGYTGYTDPQQRIVSQPNVGPARQPSNAAYLTRQPSSTPGYAPPTAPPGSLDPNTQYIDLNRSSVSPYQAAQYADISRQLGASDPNTHAPRRSLELPNDPLPSPFDDPIEATPGTPHDLSRPTEVTASGPVTVPSAPQTQGNTTEAHQRPVTVYDEGDAYGGI